MNYKYLYVLFPKKENRILFLSSVVLTFGLRLETISSLINCDTQYFDEQMKNYSKVYTSLKICFKYSIKEQGKAKGDFINYFNKLEEAHKNKDKQKLNELLKVVKDTEFIEFYQGKKPRYLSDEQILIILKYQLKYLVPTQSITKLLQLDSTNYSMRVRLLADKYPELVNDFDILSDLYKRKNSVGDINRIRRGNHEL